MEDKRLKNQITDEERLQLAKKLDGELEDFINSLEKKPYKDEWEEEITQHPFFMKNAPEPGEKLHPLYEGLQQLKYDPDENTPEELALSYKEDGNFHFKHKNYRLAVLAFTEGIKTRCGNIDLEATLLNNRSAANYFLKNYRSSLRDCELALRIKPNYDKVIVRAANCCLATAQHERCLYYCDKILESTSDHKEILKLRQDCVADRKCKERDARKKQVELRKKQQMDNLVLREIIKRNINVDCIGSLRIEHLNPHFTELANCRVSLDTSGNLKWPVVLMYPEYETMDFIQQFCENDAFVDHLRAIFVSKPEWDIENKYKVDDLIVYYENGSKTKVFKVDVDVTLKEVLQMKTFQLRGGTPSFIVFVKDSKAGKDFLGKY